MGTRLDKALRDNTWLDTFHSWLWEFRFQSDSKRDWGAAQRLADGITLLLIRLLRL